MMSTEDDLRYSSLPDPIRAIFRGLPGIWKYRHDLILRWVIFSMAMNQGKNTIKSLADITPKSICKDRIRGLVVASYWSVVELVQWLGLKAMESFPPAENGVIFLISDGSRKSKYGLKGDVNQKGKYHKYSAWFFGFKFIILIVAWDQYRTPVNFRIVLPKSHKNYRKENLLFQDMIAEFEPPSWARFVHITCDAGFGSKDNLRYIQKLNSQMAKEKVRWSFVIALPKTWKQSNGKSLRDLAYHLPKSKYKKIVIPAEPGVCKKKVFWVYSKTVTLDHIGEVTIVLSKKGPNTSPKNIKVIVTNLQGADAKKIVSIYCRRWSVEVMFRELKSGMGLGQFEMIEEERKTQNAVGLAILSYQLVIILSKEKIKNDVRWSIFTLKHLHQKRFMKAQLESNTRSQVKRAMKIAV